jgi:hypothetical protein
MQGRRCLGTCRRLLLLKRAALQRFCPALRQRAQQRLCAQLPHRLQHLLLVPWRWHLLLLLLRCRTSGQALLATSTGDFQPDLQRLARHRFSTGLLPRLLDRRRHRGNTAGAPTCSLSSCCLLLSLRLRLRLLLTAEARACSCIRRRPLLRPRLCGGASERRRPCPNLQLPIHHLQLHS